MPKVERGAIMMTREHVCRIRQRTVAPMSVGENVPDRTQFDSFSPNPRFLGQRTPWPSLDQFPTSLLWPHWL